MRFATSVTKSNPGMPGNQTQTGFVSWLVTMAAITRSSESTKNKAVPAAPALRGLHMPHTLRSSSPKLYAAHLSVYILLTLV